jgi:AcrR family transcriptional regulator
MAKKANSNLARGKQKRLPPDHRRREFVAKAAEFFSEQGFGGGTRDLARRLGVTQPLLYRYFPSKDDLIREVYRTVYLKPLDTGWEKLLTDRSRPIRDRLREFYNAYTNVIFTPHLFILGPEGAGYQPALCCRGAGQDPDAYHRRMPS